MKMKCDINISLCTLNCPKKEYFYQNNYFIPLKKGIKLYNVD